MSLSRKLHRGKCEEWIGTTEFRVLTEDMERATGKVVASAQQSKNITMCTQAWGLSIIPQSNMFVLQSFQYMTSESLTGRKPVLHLILQRQSGRSHKYQFELHTGEEGNGGYKGKTRARCLILHEMDRTKAGSRSCKLR